jgi:uncharacterized protein with PIN domain
MKAIYIRLESGLLKCRICQKELPDEAFHVTKQMINGRASECRLCRRELYRGRHHQGKRAGSVVQHNAQARLREAVKRGKIQKPGKCDDCGQMLGKNKISGHHEDYSKPFNVAWVCARCHSARHARYADVFA